MQDTKDDAERTAVEAIEAAKSDPEAFGVLYERFAERIYNYVYYRVGNRHDAEDLTARTFQRALANVASFEARGVPISAWFYRIAHNLVANFHRDRARRQTVPLESLASQRADIEAPPAAAERSERTQALLRAVRALPEDRQQLVLLKFNEHLSNAEIGQIMGKSESAVKSLYHRTLIALREDLEAQGFASDGQD